MELQEFCINHPTKKAVEHCKQCGSPLCPECRLLLTEGIFCSDTCYEEFREIRERIIDQKGRRARFSLVALLKHLAIAAVLIAFIAAVLYWWLGTLDPVEMAQKLWRDLRLMF
jgi:hypothetical protein